MTQRTGGIQIPNQLRATFRADINTALQALDTLNSGPVAPDTTYDSMLWADTTNNLLKIRNTSNSAWVTIGALNTQNLGLAPQASPTLTGVPTTPTAAAPTNTLQVASTAFVQSAIKNVGGWLDTTLVNGYTNFGGGTAGARYRLHADNVVEIYGYITKASALSGEPIFGMAPGFEPAFPIQMPIVGLNGSLVVSPTLLNISTAGTVSLFFSGSPTRFSINCFFGLG
ncbi:MAG: hypothetical protein RBJ76_13650 [Stenomitos frigidus ULC029]